jgi:hypothetical protein
MRTYFAVVTIAALTLSLPAAAAPLTRTFVSSAGSDGNPCTITQPCATFAVAYAAVAANGIVAALDPGRYGPLTITGPVTIDGNGWAAITAPSDVTAAGILITAGPSDNVILRGLVVDGADQPNTFGIRFRTGGSLAVNDCVVRNVTLTGLDFASSATTPQQLVVSNSYFISTLTGISINANGSGAITASVDRTRLSGGPQGGLVVGASSTGVATVAATDVVSVGNQSGFEVATSSSSVATLTVTRSQAVGNETGVLVNGSHATIFLAQSTVTGSTFGFQASAGGVINSYLDNFITDTGNIGMLTQVSKQ